MKKFITLTAILSLAAVLLCGCSIFKKEDPEPVVIETPEPEPEPPEIKLPYNPLTGLFDLPENRVGLRPFAISVNNVVGGLPQYGVSKADIIVEIETEGGITRLMCLFTDPSDAGQIGSIRSLRHPFINAVCQWDPVICHIGTSDYTEEYMWARDIKTMNGYNSESFLFTDKERLKTYASEHCKFTSAQLLAEGMKDDCFGLSEKWSMSSASAFNFAEEGSHVIPSSGAAVKLYYEFSSEYDGDFRFDAATGRYLKWQHGNPHIDAGNGAQLAFDNVFLLLAQINGIEGDLIDVDYADGGSGYYLSGGRFEKITWSKQSYDSDFIFKKSDGSDLVVNPGVTHLGIIRNYFDSKTVIE